MNLVAGARYGTQKESTELHSSYNPPRAGFFVSAANK